MANYFKPRRYRREVTDSNKGDRRNTKIVDTTATLALRTLASGMMSGVTSPARPWKKLTTPDPDLAEFGPVKSWLDVVDKRMDTVFIRSNLYNVLPIIYSDMGLFGTAAMAVEEDFHDVMRFYSFPIASYCIGANDRQQIEVFHREFRMTVRQILSKFANRRGKSGSIVWDNLSEHVHNQYMSGHLETWINTSHVLGPNPDFDPTRHESKYKRISSCYYETGGSSAVAGNYMASGNQEDKYLSESGYDYFPTLVPRWETTGEDVYGTDCPGMTVLGDVKALQQKKSARPKRLRRWSARRWWPRLRCARLNRRSFRATSHTNPSRARVRAFAQPMK